MAKREVSVGIIGCGLMGRELASAAGRWMHLLDLDFAPKITAACDVNPAATQWFADNVSACALVTDDYRQVLDSDVEARHLQMKVGRVAEHWHKNCLAVGLSQGFIEPLEATALNVVCNTAYDFIATVNAEGFDGKGRDGFNQRAAEGFERIRDYIVAHYILNSRDDTDYWRQNGANTNVPERLQQILQIWKSGQSLSQEMERQKIHSSYTAMSWYCLLAGYGFYPELRDVPGGEQHARKVDMTEIDDFISRCASNFRSQNEQLKF